MSSEVQFDFDEEQRPEYNHSGSKLSRLVVKWSGGLIEDEEQAHYVLLGVAILIFVILLFLFISATKPSSPLPADQIISVAGPGAKKGIPAK